MGNRPSLINRAFASDVMAMKVLDKIVANAALPQELGGGNLLIQILSFGAPQAGNGSGHALKLALDTSKIDE